MMRRGMMMILPCHQAMVEREELAQAEWGASGQVVGLEVLFITIAGRLLIIKPKLSQYYKSAIFLEYISGCFNNC